MRLRPVQSQTSSQGIARYDVELSGTKDDVNTTFTTPDKFIHIPATGWTIRVYLNGQRLSPTNDYSISESGGPSTGYDTVTLLVGLLPYERLTADYFIAS